MVSYEAKGLLTHLFTHGVKETCNKFHASPYRHVSDGAWPSVIIKHTCNSSLNGYYKHSIITTVTGNFFLTYECLVNEEI